MGHLSSSDVRAPLIVECLKEFNGELWGQSQRIKVYTDHKNLMRDALGFTCNRVYRWRLLLEEYNPEIVYIKGEDNTVADAISRLEYDPTTTKNVKDLSFIFIAHDTWIYTTKDEQRCISRPQHTNTNTTIDHISFSR